MLLASVFLTTATAAGERDEAVDCTGGCVGEQLDDELVAAFHREGGGVGLGRVNGHLGS